ALPSVGGAPAPAAATDREAPASSCPRRRESSAFQQAWGRRHRLNSCKRVGPRQEQADNNIDPCARLNVWPLVADSMMARAKRTAKPNTRMQPLRFAGVEAKRQQDGKCRIKSREAGASHHD